MQRWQDEFSKHPIHATLKILRDSASADHDISDSALEVERARLMKVIGVMEKAVSDLDPDLAPIDILGALNNQISQSGALSSVRNFASNGNANHLQDANAQITPALGYVYQLSALRPGRGPRQSDLEAATTSFERFSKKLSSRISELESRASRSIETIEQATSTIRAAEVESSLLSSQFKDKITEWGNQNSEFINSHKIGFSAILSQSKIEYNELIAAIKNEANDAVKSLLESEQAQAEANRTSISEELQRIQRDAETKHAEILKFYALVTHDSVTGGHKKIADREHDAATFWRRFTVVCILATLVWIGYSLFFLSPELEPPQLFWLQIGKSTALTMLLISFAIYASRQSNLHRRNEQKARSFFLKVQAFDPFVASLPEEQRWSMKQSMTERIFGPDEAPGDKNALDSDDFKGMEQLVTMMEKIKGLWKN
jgi:hypothetical protein